MLVNLVNSLLFVLTATTTVISSDELYCCLLPQCEALCTCHSGFSDHNKMVLWPRYEGRAVWNLHKKNVRSVRFVVKSKGCCCNLSAGVALNARRTTNEMCAKNNTICMWREQATTEWSWWSDLGEWPLIMLVNLVNSWLYMLTVKTTVISSGELCCCLLPQCGMHMPLGLFRWQHYQK